jgi:serine phosphatase RsbU (regulator of sigma subunit)/anti-sigma regulatory factor (Ser/Thr protein kinase)
MVQLMKRKRAKGELPEVVAPVREAVSQPVSAVAIPPGDPLETVLLSNGGPIEIRDLELDSPVVRELQGAGVEIVVPLIGQGELLGALYLGRRLSDQPYSTDDRRLLGNLASQVAPAIKVAQLIKEQQVEAEERERIQQELKVAALIQQTLLPKELPDIPGWGVDAFYRPAREVGGDFYDFIDLGGNRLGVVIGDVTDKGVPAALVMATSRAMLRAAALRHDSPGAVLADVNSALVPEIPPAMFVTCLYAIIDTRGGGVVFANAGHNLPYVRRADGVLELRATGMPLGLMPDITYEEKTHQLADGEWMVLTSDGITEAHNPQGQMYGFARLMARIAAQKKERNLINDLVSDLEKWSGSGEQEDDITMVVVRRTASAEAAAAAFKESLLAEFTVPSVEGNERLAIDRVSETLSDHLEPVQMERLKTAVGETVMNALEHGNQFDPSLEAEVQVFASSSLIRVRVADFGGGNELPEAATPDLEAKIAGDQSPRGWGLFLIEKMVDEVKRVTEGEKRIVELVVYKKGGA